MTPVASVFEKTYRHYLSRLAGLDSAERAEKLGGKSDGKRIIIPFFGVPYSIDSNGIWNVSGKRPSYAVCVVLSQYVIRCPCIEPSGTDWVSYRDFKDGAPFAGAFANNAEQTLARYFSGRLHMLDTACAAVGCRKSGIKLAYDVVRIFDALPKVPILMLFNDRDDEFSATCSLLFESRAETYLDMECLAIIGWHLADRLKAAFGGSGAGLM